MRIGLVIYGSLDTVSGGYLYDRKLVRHLRSQGDEVVLFSQAWTGYRQRLRQNDDPELLAQIEKSNLDLLLQDELNHPSLFRLNLQLKIQARYPILSIVHHLRTSEGHPIPVRWLYQQVERRYLQTVDAFIFNSYTTKATVERLLGREVQGLVAYPGGDQYGSRASEVDVIARSQKEGPLELLFVGNLVERKALHILVHALSRITSSKWRLRIVGDDSIQTDYVESIRKQIADAGIRERISFLGKLSSFRVREELQNAQVLVVPSSYEGFGIVYLEAMSFGVVPLATSSGAAGEIITHDENGLLVPPNDPESLASYLDELSDDRLRLKQLSLNAWQRFAEFLGWKESMESIRSYLVNYLDRWKAKSLP